MLNECLAYLERKLLPVMGEDYKPFTRLADLKLCMSSHVCSTIPDSDVITFNGSTSLNLETKVNDTRLFDRAITVAVVLGEYNIAALEPLFEAFLASLDRGFLHAGHYIDLTPGEAGWVDEKDSRLKAAVAVEIPIVFTGGVYRPRQFGKIETISIEREDHYGKGSNL